MGLAAGIESGIQKSGNFSQDTTREMGRHCRFEGIKGNLTSKAKDLPVEKGEAGAKGSGEGTITYTLPSK